MCSVENKHTDRPMNKCRAVLDCCGKGKGSGRCLQRRKTIQESLSQRIPWKLCLQRLHSSGSTFRSSHIQSTMLDTGDKTGYRIYHYLCPRNFTILDDTEYKSYVPKHKTVLNIIICYLPKDPKHIFFQVK